MLCDAHVHVGYFRSRYFPPDAVVCELRKMGIRRWAVSSSSASGRPWSFVRRECERITEIAPKESALLLWVTPSMLKRSRDLSRYMIFPFCGFKIHGANGWQPLGQEIERLFSIAQERNWPILVHTGDDPVCQAGQYETICLQYPRVRIILAHGRPIDQTVRVMKRATNAWTDTSFMPNRGIRFLIRNRLEDRVLYGSDCPAPTIFYKTPIARYCRRRIESLRIYGKSAFRKITTENFNRVYGQGWDRAGFRT